MWMIEWSLKGLDNWQVWGGPYNPVLATGLMTMLNHDLFEYRKVPV